MDIKQTEKDYPCYLDLPRNPKRQTNADRIRAMTDEELAEWIDKQHNEDRTDWESIGCYHCINYGTHHSDKTNIGTKFEYLYECKGCEFENGILHWLKAKLNKSHHKD